MNIKTVKKSQKRVDVSYLSSLKIQAYGHDNLYPQNAYNLISASSNGRSCLNRYARFIEGNGFKEIAFSEYVVNRSGETADAIQTLMAKDLAQYGGFALHVNYNLFGDIVELQHVPFESCRLQEADDKGFIANIITHIDWTGNTTRNGKNVKVSKGTVEEFPVFNPRKEVVQDQIVKAGGIEFYKGQILWVSMAGLFTYPAAKYDSAITELSTDEGLSTLKYRNVRNNFYPAGVFAYKKSNSANVDEEEEEDLDPQGYAEEIAQLQGDEKSCSMLAVGFTHESDIPKFIEFPIKNLDKDFTVTNESVCESIYAAFEQEIFYAIRKGKTGFSGNLMKEAYEYYNSIVNTEQRMIERAFDRIFRDWYEDVNPTKNYSIKPLQYISNETPNNN